MAGKLEKRLPNKQMGRVQI